MPKIITEKNIKELSKKDLKRLEELEFRCDEIIDLLFDDPGNERLSAELREVELNIVRITKEKTIDY